MRALYYFRPAVRLYLLQVAGGVLPLVPPSRPLLDHLVIDIAQTLTTLRDGGGDHVVEVRELLALRN